MNNSSLKDFESLEDYLENCTPSCLPKVSRGKNHIDRYKALVSKFENYPVEIGALKNALEKWIADTQKKAEEYSSIEDEQERLFKMNELFTDDPFIFLNKHDNSHTQNVQEKAYQLLCCFNNFNLSQYEAYLLLCAAVVHDIGNILGRDGHECNISKILDSECRDILPDSVERRTISRIARAHGGKISGDDADTINQLKTLTPVNGIDVHERILASILRFADELADDSTRANYDWLESEIITDESKIYHIYSESLHTVELKKNEVNNSYSVVLAYEFDYDIAKTLYGSFKNKRYLLDEIYLRTIKMERERRYCIRYLRPYCPLECVMVSITITNPLDEFESEPITYTLSETGYPKTPYATIKDVDDTILTGVEFVKKISKEE